MQQELSHQVPTQQNPYQDVLILPRQGRTMSIGRTRSGKSTLSETLFRTYMRKYPSARALIVDTKPHFQAQWEITGTSAAFRYRKYDRNKMCYIAGSYRLPLDQSFKKSLDQIWRHGGRVAIVQVNQPGSISEWPFLMNATKIFYEKYGHEPPRLIWVNELADFFEVQKLGGIFWLLPRSGGELNISFLGETQRPAYIPKTVMTESGRIYVFQLDYSEDIKRLYEVGFPRDVELPDVDHEFLLYDKYRPRGQRLVGKFKLGGIHG